MDSQMLTFFVAVTSIAVVIQAGILVGLYLSVRKTSARALAIAEQVESRAVPALENAQAILADTGPKLQLITSNLVDVTTALRDQVERADLTVADALDRTRLQIIRADELVSRALDKVEETSEMVQESVVGPVRQISAVIQAVSAGLGFFFKHRRRAGGRATAAEQDEELFI